MILKDTAIINWSNRNKSFIESKGYIFTNIGDEVEIRINDLSNGSTAKIEVICDYCGCIINKQYGNHLISRKNCDKDSCNKCKYYKISEFNLLKLSIEYVMEFILHNSDCTLLSSEYIDIKDKLVFKCSCGNIFKTSFNSFKNSNKRSCNSCGHVRIGEAISYEFEEVNDIIKSNGCILLSDSYNGSHGKLNLLCRCGDEFSTTFSAFLHSNKRQCNKCGILRRSGENHNNWNGGTTSERDKIRKSDDYSKWRRHVFEHNNYTCQACGDDKGSNLHAHHILNFSNNEELRFDILNGITLCEYCHNPSIKGSFHHAYGTKNNTREQIEEYIDNRKKE